MIAKRSQFFIIASVVILLNLVMISQYVIRSTFPVSERPLDEFAYETDVHFATDDISRSALPYLLKRNLWALDTYSKSATGWDFEFSLCCMDTCDCSSLNLANFTVPSGQTATLVVASDKASIASSLVIKSG